MFYLLVRSLTQVRIYLAIEPSVVFLANNK